MIEHIRDENVILRILKRLELKHRRERYTAIPDLAKESEWLCNKAILMETLDRLAKSGRIRLKGINTTLYVTVTDAGVIFLIECGTLYPTLFERF